MVLCSTMLKPTVVYIYSWTALSSLQRLHRSQLCCLHKVNNNIHTVSIPCIRSVVESDNCKCYAKKLVEWNWHQIMASMHGHISHMCIILMHIIYIYTISVRQCTIINAIGTAHKNADSVEIDPPYSFLLCVHGYDFLGASLSESHSALHVNIFGYSFGTVVYCLPHAYKIRGLGCTGIVHQRCTISGWMTAAWNKRHTRII